METGHYKNMRMAAGELAGDLGVRLEYCADTLGGKRALADAAGISEAQLFRYIRGDSKIPAEKALDVARVAKVDPSWLLSGAGKPEGITVPRRPEFRPELMAKLTQVFTEVMADYPNRLSPYQRGKFLALAYESMRHEEMGRDVEIIPSRNEVFTMLEYLGRASFDEMVNIHDQAYRRLALGLMPEDGDPFWEMHFCNAVQQGQLNKYSGPAGEGFFRRVSNQMSEDSVNRLALLITEASKNQREGRIRWLDIGCGNGREMEFVSRNANADCYGVEQSEVALRELALREKAGQFPAGRVATGEMRMLPYPDASFDVVYSRMSLFCQPYLPGSGHGVETAMREMARTVKPGGLVSIVTARGSGFCLLPYLQMMEAGDLINMAAPLGLTPVRQRDFESPRASGNDRVRRQVEVLFKKTA